MRRADFPFTAVVGQDRLKTALILAAIEPGLAGVLVSGPRGTAKSTLARGLAALDTRAAGGFVTLPLGATEEQVIGTLDLSRALGAGEVAYRPGLIGRAHGGYLYIDEVNLLADPLVDVLLDVAASKINRIERDGISREHAAEFVLIGTMNPEEGELRPQFADRFGLCVELETGYDASQRRAIVDQRLAYEHDPAAFAATHVDAETALATKIETARQRLEQVECGDAMKDAIAERCMAAGVEGVRADIHWRQAARAHAAWQGREAIAATDIDAVAEYVLCHRRTADEAAPNTDPDGGQSDGGSDDQHSAGNESASNASDDGWGGLPPRQLAAQPARNIVAPVPQNPPRHAPARASTARHTRTATGEASVSALTGMRGARIDWPGTLAGRALNAGAPETPRYRPAKPATARLNCILLDTSASTAGRQSQSEARAAIAGLARHAVAARERFAVLAFGGERIDWLIAPRRASRRCATELAHQPVGGGTPLARALTTARQRLERMTRREPGLALRTFVFTDGRCRDRIAAEGWPGELMVVDTERARVPLHRAQRLAATLGGDYVGLDDLLGQRP